MVLTTTIHNSIWERNRYYAAFFFEGRLGNPVDVVGGWRQTWQHRSFRPLLESAQPTSPCKERRRESWFPAEQSNDIRQVRYARCLILHLSCVVGYMLFKSAASDAIQRAGLLLSLTLEFELLNFLELIAIQVYHKSLQYFLNPGLCW